MIDRLIEAIQKTHAPICVGLDPQMSFIPEEVKEKAFREYGHTMEGAAEAIWQFNKAIVDAVYDLIPSVKPQIAMYEQYGIEGLKAFDKTVRYCQQKGLIVIGDVKRGDIGSTSAAYAAAHLGTVTIGEQEHAAFGEDFCTVNPYLGSDGVQPFIKECAAHGKGIFVLVKTSNPSSGEFQDRMVVGDDGQTCPLYELVGKKVDEWASDPALTGKHGYSAVGAVVGATYPEMGDALRSGRIASLMLDSDKDELWALGGPLADLPNLHLTPRLAAYTREAVLRGSWFLVDRIHETLSAGFSDSRITMFEEDV